MPLCARNQPVQRRDARFPARGERRIEGKGRKLIEDALQPHAAHAHARVPGQQRVREGIERGIAERIAIEGEIGIHGAQPPIVRAPGNRLRRARKRRDKVKPVFPCAQGTHGLRDGARAFLLFRRECAIAHALAQRLEHAQLVPEKIVLLEQKRQPFFRHIQKLRKLIERAQVPVVADDGLIATRIPTGRGIHSRIQAQRFRRRARLCRGTPQRPRDPRAGHDAPIAENQRLKFCRKMRAAQRGARTGFGQCGHGKFLPY